MSEKVAVVIPQHKEELSELEKISLAQCRKVLDKYPIIFAIPKGKNFSYITPENKIIYFPTQCFQTLQAYNILMMSPQFYAAFKDFDYILTYELDAFVFRDELEYFCSLGYDYIGGPWSALASWIRYLGKNVSRVGNSGFCLRNVKAHYNLLSNNFDWVSKFFGINNDNFFSRCGQISELNFRVAPYNVACKFSADVNPRRIIKKNGGKLPFGCHGWFKSDGDFYTSIFQQFGYDLSPLQDKMKHVNHEEELKEELQGEAIRRLERRIQRGQSIVRYLPTNRFASVRVIRHPLTLMIIARIIMEEPSLADKIFLYDFGEEDLLIHDLKLEKQPHLIIGAGGGVR